MVAAFVAQRGVYQGSGSTTSFNLVVNAATVVGDHLVLRVVTAGDSTVWPSSVSDPRGNVWQLDSRHARVDQSLAVFSCRVATSHAANDLLTVTKLGSSNSAASLDEFSGLVATGWLDVISSSTATNAFTFNSGNTLTTAQADALLVGAIGLDADFTVTPETVTPPWSLLGSAASSGTSIRYLRGAYRVVSATGTYRLFGSFGSSGTANSTAAILVYKAAATGGAATISGPSTTGTGTQTFTGTGAVKTAGPSTTGTGTQTFEGDGSVTISRPSTTGTGMPILLGTGEATISGPSAIGTGTTAAEYATGTVTIAGPSTTGTGTVATSSVSGGRGVLLAATPGQQVRATLHAVSMLDVNATVKVRIDKLPEGAASVASVFLRVIEGNYYACWLAFQTSGTLYLTIRKYVGTILTVLQGVALPVAPVVDTDFSIRFGVADTTLRAKAWLTSEAEPLDWQLTVPDTTAVLQGPGAVGLGARINGGTTNAPVAFSFDELVT